MGGGVVGIGDEPGLLPLARRVTLIEGARRLLASEEEFACEQVTEALARAGRRHPHRPQGDAVRRDGGRVAVSWATARRHRRRSCSSPSAGGRSSKGSAGDHRSGGRRATSRSTPTRVPGHDWLYVIGDLNGRARSRTWRSTRRRSPATTARQGRGARAPRRRAGLAARDLHRSAGLPPWGTEATARGGGMTVQVWTSPTSGNAGGCSTAAARAARAASSINEERGVMVGATTPAPRSRTSSRRRRSPSSARSRSRLRHADSGLPHAQRDLALPVQRARLIAGQARGAAEREDAHQRAGERHRRRERERPLEALGQRLGVGGQSPARSAVRCVATVGEQREPEGAGLRRDVLTRPGREARPRGAHPGGGGDLTGTKAKRCRPRSQRGEEQSARRPVGGKPGEQQHPDGMRICRRRARGRRWRPVGASPPGCQAAMVSGVGRHARPASIGE